MTSWRGEVAWKYRRVQYITPRVAATMRFIDKFSRTSIDLRSEADKASLCETALARASAVYPALQPSNVYCNKFGDTFLCTLRLPITFELKNGKRVAPFFTVLDDFVPESTLRAMYILERVDVFRAALVNVDPALADCTPASFRLFRTDKYGAQHYVRTDEELPMDTVLTTKLFSIREIGATARESPKHGAPVGIGFRKSAAPAAPPTNHAILGMGEYGCVYEAPRPCTAKPETVTVEGIDTALPLVYKVQREDDGKTWRLNSVILGIDPTQELLLPYESTCPVDNRDAVGCKPLERAPRVLQLAMRKGTRLTQSALSHDGMYDDISISHVQQLATLCKGVAKMASKGYVHGDIKLANSLLFSAPAAPAAAAAAAAAAESKIMLIDYDFFASMFLVPLHRHVETALGRPVTRELVLDSLSDAYVQNTVFPQFDTTYFFAFARTSYFPPENHVTDACVQEFYARVRSPWRKRQFQCVQSCIDMQIHLMKKELRATHAAPLLRETLDIFRSESEYMRRYTTDFLQGTVMRGLEFPADDAAAQNEFYAQVFQRAYYPHAHDAFQLGYFLAEFVCKFDPPSSSVYARKLLKIANKLLCPNPAARLTTAEAAAKLQRIVDAK